MALTAKDLKNAILQMAMEGKLVEQRLEEGTGQELFDSVQIRQKVVSLEKQKPVIPSDLGEYSFNIPESWKWCRIGDLFEHNTGKALNSSNKTGKLYEYITTSNVFWNRFELKKLRTMLYKDDELERCSVRKGDLLVLEGGDIGRAAIWNFDYPMRIQNHIHKLRPYGEISVEFFYYVFRYYKFAGLIDGKGIGIQGLSTKALHNLVVPLPPLAEQKRIVAKIESILPSLDAFEKAQTKLDELNASYKEGLKKSILQYAMEGKLVSQDPREEPASALLDRIQEEKKKLIKEKKIKADKNESVIFRRNGFFYERIDKEEKCIDDEIPFKIPESWEWTRLKNIASTQLGKALNTSKDQGELVPYLCSINVYWNTIDVSQVKKARFSVDEKKKFSVQPGDIFVVEGGDAGRTAIWEGKDQVYYQNALHRVRFLPNAIVPLFFVFLMKTYKGLGLLGGKSKGMTIQHFVKHELDALLLPLPPLAEQKRIVATIKTIFAVLDGN